MGCEVKKVRTIYVKDPDLWDRMRLQFPDRSMSELIDRALRHYLQSTVRSDEQALLERRVK